MNLTLTERRLGAGEANERVVFTCPGCGLDTVVHVGLQSVLMEKRCMKCRDTSRTGRGGTPAVKGRRIGTHEGRRKDRKDANGNVKYSAEDQRKVKRAATLRNRTRRGSPTRPPCRSYDECSHRKHSVAGGR